jgi:hypothetical protein
MNVWGKIAPFLPPAPPIDLDEDTRRSFDRAGELLIGAAEGTGEIALNIARDMVLNTWTFGGGALVLPHSEHIFTRTYGGRGGATLRAEQGMSFRGVLARDMRDIRQLFGPKYDQGLRDLLQYYRQNFPERMAK